MREALRQRASDLATDAAVKVHSHKSAAETWAWARYGLGVPAAVLAALAGYFALGEENLGWGGLMALAAAVLSTLMTALKPGEEVTKHHQAAGRFGDIRNRAKTLATVDVESTLDEHALRTKLEALQAGDRCRRADRRGWCT